MNDPDYVDVGPVTRFPRGSGHAVDLCGTRVAIFRLPDRWIAVQDACPHMGLSLADGRIEANDVVCHGHGWCFDLDSGKSDRRSGAALRLYEIRIDNDRVLLHRPPDKPTAPPSDDDDEAWMRADPNTFFRKK